MEKILMETNPITVVLVILLLCWAFNLVYSAVTNAKSVHTQTREPFARIDASIGDIRVRVETLERQVRAHDDDIQDLHTGQSVLCRGVQALLEHEMHNGNEDEMRAASDGIGKWLRTR